MWGGIEIYVPDGWAVEVRAVPLLGGVDDKTIMPKSDDAPRLVVHGLVVMGGMEIKH